MLRTLMTSGILLGILLMQPHEPVSLKDNIILMKQPEREIFENTPFDKGEKLVYAVTWAGINAGKAVIEVRDRVMINGVEAFHVVISAKTNRFFSVFFKVDDRIESFFECKSLHTLRFEKTLNEGDYKEKRVIEYDHIRGVFRMMKENPNRTKHKEGIIPFWVKDPISSIYYLRVCDLAVGKPFSISMNAEGQNFSMEVNIEKKEKKKTKLGKFDTFVVKPNNLDWQGRVFEKRKSTMTIWFTDDEYRIPVLLKSKVKIGSLKFELEKWRKPKNIDPTSSYDDEDDLFNDGDDEVGEEEDTKDGD